MNKIIFLGFVSLAFLFMPVGASYSVGLGTVEKFSYMQTLQKMFKYQAFDAINDNSFLDIDNQDFHAINYNSFLDGDGSTPWQGVTIKGSIITYRNALGDIIVQTKLPFLYLRLLKKDIDELYYVAQNRMTVIEQGERALVGPLSPCIGVFVTIFNENEYKTLAMHADILQTGYWIIKQIKKFITKEKVDEKSIRKILLYTQKADDDDDKNKQKELFNDVFSLLRLEFDQVRIECVATEQTVNKKKFKDTTGFCLPVYTNAASTVVVAADGTYFNTCLVTEPIPHFLKGASGRCFTTIEDYELALNMLDIVRAVGNDMLLLSVCSSCKAITKFGPCIKEKIKLHKQFEELLK